MRYGLFKIRIELGNAAFSDPEEGHYEPFEVARILRQVASRVEDGEKDGALRDVNGNKVGFFAHTPEEN